MTARPFCDFVLLCQGLLFTKAQNKKNLTESFSGFYLQAVSRVKILLPGVRFQEVDAYIEYCSGSIHQNTSTMRTPQLHWIEFRRQRIVRQGRRPKYEHPVLSFVNMRALQRHDSNDGRE